MYGDLIHSNGHIANLYHCSIFLLQMTWRPSLSNTLLNTSWSSTKTTCKASLRSLRYTFAPLSLFSGFMSSITVLFLMIQCAVCRQHKQTKPFTRVNLPSLRLVGCWARIVFVSFAHCSDAGKCALIRTTLGRYLMRLYIDFLILTRWSRERWRERSESQRLIGEGLSAGWLDGNTFYLCN